jgi:hypothetical protein
MCDKIFASKQNLDNHKYNCVTSETKTVNNTEKQIRTEIELSFLKEKLLEKEKHIENMQKKIDTLTEKLLSKTTIVNNTNNIHMKIKNVMSKEFCKEKIELLQQKDIENGVDGYCDFVVEKDRKSVV